VVVAEADASSELRQMARLLLEYSVHMSKTMRSHWLRLFILSISCAEASGGESVN